MPSKTYLTLRPGDAALLRTRVPHAASSALVVALCADWCGTCRSFEAIFDEIAQRHPDAVFVWLDVEDDSDVAGDVDVENFPALAVFHRGQPLYYGVTLPPQAARLVDALLMDPSRKVEVPAEIAELPELLHAHVEGQ